MSISGIVGLAGTNLREVSTVPLFPLGMEYALDGVIYKYVQGLASGATALKTAYFLDAAGRLAAAATIALSTTPKQLVVTGFVSIPQDRFGWVIAGGSRPFNILVTGGSTANAAVFTSATAGTVSTDTAGAVRIQGLIVATSGGASNSTFVSVNGGAMFVNP